MAELNETIAGELGVQPAQVAAAVELLDNGATVPFIARYRKEATQGLDDTQLRQLEERLRYLRELEERRATILDSIAEQDKLTPELKKAIQAADTKTRLEDLYLPYKPRRRTKAQKAREAGLDPLAQQLLQDPSRDPEAEAAHYLNEEHGVTSAAEALDGAKRILAEDFSENAELLARVRDLLWQHGLLRSAVVSGKEEEGAKFRDYFDYQEALGRVASHRALAMFRGRKEGILNLHLALPEEQENAEPHPCIAEITRAADWRHSGRAADDWLAEVMRWSWRVKLYSQLETELLGRVREMAEDEAINVFARNLRSLLMASPAGARTTLGLDPGLRTGVKVVVVDGTGKLVEHTTIYPHQPKNQWQQSRETLARLVQEHGVELIAIGNGTATRETDQLAGELLQQLDAGENLHKIRVSEAGASVYSASEIAAKEFPNLDVSFRGAVSIARRLQDPLAELVKIEPKSIGVGQYQHDVSQTKLARQLDAVVEDCVNAVGVDVNTASAPLLARVSGLTTTSAGNIVRYRDDNGAFPDRRTLKQVPRLGERTFELSAGFLRVPNGDNPLDASAVHPEAYPVVERMAAANDRPVASLIGDGDFLRSLKAEDYIDAHFGVPTVTDILGELEKPGRDPRPEFKAAVFRDDVSELKDLTPGMILEGSVTNVTNFGAFVDIGVHQDGLVHVSVLANRFVKDPHEVVAPGDIVRVKVMEVDQDRKRISLSMRLDERHGDKPQGKAASNQSGDGASKGNKRGGKGKGKGRNKPEKAPEPQGALAQAFARAKEEKNQ
jgi:uncharacterized protein